MKDHLTQVFFCLNSGLYSRRGTFLTKMSCTEALAVEEYSELEQKDVLNKELLLQKVKFDSIQILLLS